MRCVDVVGVGFTASVRIILGWRRIGRLSLLRLRLDKYVGHGDISIGVTIWFSGYWLGDARIGFVVRVAGWSLGPWVRWPTLMVVWLVWRVVWLPLMMRSVGGGIVGTVEWWRWLWSIGSEWTRRELALLIAGTGVVEEVGGGRSSHYDWFREKDRER